MIVLELSGRALESFVEQRRPSHDPTAARDDQRQPKNKQGIL
jgi:hypothetical protein